MFANEERGFVISSLQAMPPTETPPGADSESSDHTLRIQQLFVAHQGKVLAFILSLQPGFSAADDILQETFLVVSRKADAFEVGTNFLAWACTIARFKVLEFRRRQTSASPQLSDEALHSLTAEIAEEAFFDERLAVLRGCLHRLAPRARELIWQRYHGGHEPEEIAREISWTPGAVRVALSRARASLRECVETRMAKGAA